MEMLLITITGVSLLAALAMGVMLARMVREERRRSDARVALLQELSADTRRGAPRPVRPQAAFDDFEIRPAASPAPAAHGDIFQEHVAPSPWPRRAVVIGTFAVLLAVGLAAWKAGTPSADIGARSASVPAAPESGHPLELLSMKHATVDGTFTITGLVQNPRSARTLARVEATVLVFDQAGSMIASGRSPLDFTTLTPGDESPFVIRVPVTGAVARYRVGFRDAGGGVLSHVDRRQSESLARKQAP